MTDSGGAGTTTPGKRERLIEAARVRIHQQGVEKTTIADVATSADVPLGNVYYYFKTKDELVEAVIAAHLADITGLLASLERHRSPQTRLKAFVRALVSRSDEAARYGCPHGTLCSELDKRGDDLARAAGGLLQPSVDWAELQFRSMGRRDARDLAMALMAAYQGISLLANTFGEPALMRREARRLEGWIDSLAT